RSRVRWRSWRRLPKKSSAVISATRQWLAPGTKASVETSRLLGKIRLARAVLERGIHRSDVHAIAHGIASGKCLRNLLRYFPRGRPLRAPLQCGDETHAAQGRDIVPHRGVEDAPLAVVENHEYRLVVARSFVARIGVRSRENR